LLFALLAVAAPVPQFVMYEQCTIVDPARFWCNVLVANYRGDAYCCDIARKQTTTIGQHCVALDHYWLSATCNVLYIGAQTAWCCESLGQPDVDNGHYYNDDDPTIEDDAWQDLYSSVTSYDGDA